MTPYPTTKHFIFPVKKNIFILIIIRVTITIHNGQQVENSWYSNKMVFYFGGLEDCSDCSGLGLNTSWKSESTMLVRWLASCVFRLRDPYQVRWAMAGVQISFKLHFQIVINSKISIKCAIDSLLLFVFFTSHKYKLSYLLGYIVIKRRKLLELIWP